MLTVIREFKVHCSEKAAPHVMHIINENHIDVISLEPYESRIRPEGPVRICFKCTANEEDLDKFMDYFSKVTLPHVAISY
mgnify:CR=1 FL=1